MLRATFGTPEEVGRPEATCPVSLMGSFVVVEGQVNLQGPFELTTMREVSPAEGHTPMLVEDRSLKTFDEAVGPCVSGFRPRMADLQALTGGIKRAPKLATPIGEDPLKGPSSGFVDWQQSFGKEAGSVFSRIGRDDAGRSVRAGRIASRDLPDLAHAFKSADVEGVQTDELAGLVGLHVPFLPSGARQVASSAFREQSRSFSAVLLQHNEPLLPSAQPHAAQRTVDGTGRQVAVASSQVQRVETGSTGGVRKSDRQNGLLVLRRQTVWASSLPLVPSRVKPIPPVALISIFPPVKQGAGYPQLPAGRRHIAQRFGSL